MAPSKARDGQAWAFVLCLENQRIAKRVIRKWKSRVIAPEDLAQVGQLGLFAAIEHWRGGSWGEWIACAESWISYELQSEAARHRVAHVPDDDMRIARKVQSLRRKFDEDTVAEVMIMSIDDVRTWEAVPLSGGRSELSPMVVGRQSYRVDSEDRTLAALDAKRAGATLASIDNAGEKQPDLPALQDIAANRQPMKPRTNKQHIKFDTPDLQLGFPLSN